MDDNYPHSQTCITASTTNSSSLLTRRKLYVQVHLPLIVNPSLHWTTFFWSPRPRTFVTSYWLWLKSPTSTKSCTTITATSDNPFDCKAPLYITTEDVLNTPFPCSLSPTLHTNVPIDNLQWTQTILLTTKLLLTLQLKTFSTLPLLSLPYNCTNRQFTVTSDNPFDYKAPLDITMEDVVNTLFPCSLSPIHNKDLTTTAGVLIALFSSPTISSTNLLIKPAFLKANKFTKDSPWR